MARKQRTEALSPVFVDRKAVGWAFDVGDCFRMQLDIRLDERVDRDAAAAKRKKLGRALTPAETPTRPCWTQGSPAAYSFDRGQMLHQRGPDGIVQRTVYVHNARPDSGALRERRTDDDETVVVEDSDGDVTGDGWVEFEVITYRASVECSRDRLTLTQRAFVHLLQGGTVPAV